MSEQQRDPREIRAIIDQFRGKPINASTLKSFCERKHYAVITPGEFEDWLFAYEHEERLATIIPAILKALAKWKYPGELLDDNERRALKAANQVVEGEICKILEDNGVLYQEIELVTRNLGDAFRAILENAGTRASNMCAAVFTHVAKEKYGPTLPLKVLADAHRETIEEKQ